MICENEDNVRKYTLENKDRPAMVYWREAYKKWKCIVYINGEIVFQEYLPINTDCDKVFDTYIKAFKEGQIPPVLPPV